MTYQTYGKEIRYILENKEFIFEVRTKKRKGVNFIREWEEVVHAHDFMHGVDVCKKNN